MEIGVHHSQYSKRIQSKVNWHFSRLIALQLWCSPIFIINTISAKGGSKSGVAGFNVAENFALSKDLESQAEELISRIKRNTQADLRKDWKV